MKAVIVCHLENDLRNNFGEAKKIPLEKQTFEHVPKLLNWIGTLKIPITVSVMAGGQVGNRLLLALKEKNVKIPNNINLGIHFHAENFTNSKWQYEKPLELPAYENYYNQFVQSLSIKPKTVVFGKWKVDRQAYPLFAKLGITHDASNILPRGIINPPANINGLITVPGLSYNGQPVNPLTRLSDFLLTKKIISRYHNKNLLLHLAFHSYDFFSPQNPTHWRGIKKIIFTDILSQLKKHNVEIVNLENVNSGKNETLEKMPVPLLGRLFQLIGH
ncbi:MAG: hypothetical protein COT91_00430 [Candidatus Doudnabacteria bacterium CG10_big_fil_rev_8_21_14_0_10_41_10]|uniref:NodB homology domain-containing protein n=1 Tax=Candidatus Doudnabacteria bacterium CG10_big_fil_rev_8_21_14_0_10_41_10 TaxID=1974551 RepID=A0A2H0VEQ4_9BACT|nr:MAG: hypothetical protein COT91_00430 [Candidatus Doudnabacteria bacterium CG10_big_fil_rev_8_21_14_0_10_41_10]